MERLARDFDLIFSTLRLERDYIDAADRCLTQLTFTRRTQPAYPVVVARCGLAPGNALKVDKAGLVLAVFNLDGEFFVTADACTHGLG